MTASGTSSTTPFLSTCSARRVRRSGDRLPARAESRAPPASRCARKRPSRGRSGHRSCGCRGEGDGPRGSARAGRARSAAVFKAGPRARRFQRCVARHHPCVFREELGAALARARAQVPAQRAGRAYCRARPPNRSSRDIAVRSRASPCIQSSARQRLAVKMRRLKSGTATVRSSADAQGAHAGRPARRLRWPAGNMLGSQLSRKRVRRQ